MTDDDVRGMLLLAERGFLLPDWDHAIPNLCRDLLEARAQLLEGLTSVTYDPVYEDGEFNEESAVIELLADGVLFTGPRGEGVMLIVNCNDLFYWATADTEGCKYGELESLYKAWKDDPHWGVSIWCCFHRQLQPQKPVREKMQRDGVWTDALAALPEPGELRWGHAQ